MVGFLVVADSPQGRQHVGKRWFLLARVPRSNGELNESMADLMEPHHHNAVEEERHRSGPLDRLDHSIGLLSKAHELLTILKGAFDRPATGIGRKDLLRVPVEIGAVEHLIGPRPFEVAGQNDRQQAVAAGLVGVRQSLEQKRTVSPSSTP